MIVTYDHQNMFIIQDTGLKRVNFILEKKPIVQNKLRLQKGL